MQNATEIVNTFTPAILGKCKFPLIVVYHNPSDFPGKYVARLWDADNPTKYAVIADSLTVIHSTIPENMNCLARTKQDDPCIQETWF